MGFDTFYIDSEFECLNTMTIDDFAQFTQAHPASDWDLVVGNVVEYLVFRYGLDSVYFLWDKRYLSSYADIRYFSGRHPDLAEHLDFTPEEALRLLEGLSVNQPVQLSMF